jgi:hypothetical protein
MCIFLGPFEDALKWPKTAQKPLFWLFWTISPKRMNFMTWLGLMFSEMEVVKHTLNKE